MSNSSSFERNVLKNIYMFIKKWIIPFLTAIGVGQFCLQNLPTAVITMEEDSQSGMIWVELAPDTDLVNLATIYYQIDHGKNIKYTGKFKIAPQQAVSAHTYYAPLIKGKTIEKNWPGDSLSMSSSLKFSSDGSIVINRDTITGNSESESISAKSSEDIDLINQDNFARLTISHDDLRRLRKTAAQLGFTEIEVILRRDDPGNPRGVVWVCFLVSGRSVDLELQDSYLYLPYEIDTPQKVIAERVANPDGLDKKWTGQIPGAVADGEFVAVPIRGTEKLQLAVADIGESDISGWAEVAFCYAVSHNILLDEDQVQLGEELSMEHMLTFLCRCEEIAEGCINPNTDEWLMQALNWARSKKIIILEDINDLDMAADFSRSELAMLLWYCARIGKGSTNEVTALRWAVDMGLMTEDQNGNINPEQTVTREMGLEVIWRWNSLQAGLGTQKQRIYTGLPYLED